MNSTHQSTLWTYPLSSGVLNDASSLIVSFYLSLFIVVLGVLLKPDDMLHWFLLPVTLCGVLIGIDAVDWLRGRMDVMDPVGWVGLFGVHFFFIAPLLVVLWDRQMNYLPAMPDWRPWLGRMGILNLAGLLLYRVARGWIRIPANHSSRKIRVIQPRIFVIILYFALCITFGLQMLVYIQSGGVSGYIARYESRGDEIGFQGLGVLFTFSESFPFLLFIGIAIHIRQHESRQTWFHILIILLLFFVLRLFFGGLRGSRSNTIYAMVWAVGVIHLWIRPVPKRFLAAGAIVAVAFLYIMGFYKALGSDFFKIFEKGTDLAQLEKQTNRTFEGAIIGDLSRADVQAYMLRNLTEKWEDFPYAHGRTYLAGYTVIIPRAIWPSKPPHKVMEGTQALSGPGTYAPGVREASRVYGLMGEAMLNFGVRAAPLSFISLGLLVGMVRRWYYQLHSDDIFRLWIPFLILFCVTYIVSDSDNNAVSLVMRPLMPAIILWFGSRSTIIKGAQS